MLDPEVVGRPKLAWLPDIEVWVDPVLRAALGNPAAVATPPWPVEEVTVPVVSTDVTAAVVACGCVMPLGAVVIIPPVVVPVPGTDGAVTEIPATVAPPIPPALVVTAGGTVGGIPPLDTPPVAIVLVVLVDATPVLETGCVTEEPWATGEWEDPPKE